MRHGKSRELDRQNNKIARPVASLETRQSEFISDLVCLESSTFHEIPESHEKDLSPLLHIV